MDIIPILTAKLTQLNANFSASFPPPNLNNQYQVTDVTPWALYGWSGTAYTKVGGTATTGAAGPLAQYMGQVATRCGFSVFTKFNGTVQIQNRTIHQATDYLTAPRVIFGTATNQAVNLDTNATIECSIEYPLNSGNYHRRLFSGVNVGTITPTALITSDTLNTLNAGITIPKGAFFAVRSLLTASGSTGIQATATSFTPVGAPYYEGSITSSTATQTNIVVTTATGGTSGNNDGFNTPTTVFRPLAIIDNTTQPSIFLAGDSITYGLNDVADGYNRQGMVERSLGNIGMINAGQPSEAIVTVNSTPTTFATRATLIQYCSHIIVQYGINDIVSASATASTLSASLNTFRTTYGIGKYMLACTLLPLTTTTDSFVTVANQTVFGNDVNRVAYNKALRSNALVGYIGIIDYEGASLDNYAVSKWKVAPAGFQFTGDGIHPSQIGANYIGSNVKVNLF